jgi:polysaccharide pyruvyl transferase WcaK-like protein
MRAAKAGRLGSCNLLLLEQDKVLLLGLLEVLLDAEVALGVAGVEVLELLDKVLGNLSVLIGERLHRLVEGTARAVFVDD